MKSFQIKRFWHTLRWYISENRNKLLGWSLGLSMIVLANEAFNHFLMLNTGAKNEIDNGDIAQIVFGIGIFISLIAMLIAFSCISTPLKTKQKRIAYFTLPATNLERYLVCLIYVLVIWPVCIMAGTALGDLLHTLLFGLLGKGWDSGVIAHVSDLFTSGKTTNMRAFLQESVIYSGLFWVVSVYILCGIWLRKRAFPITTLAFFALSILVLLATDFSIHHLSKEYLISLFMRITPSMMNTILIGTTLLFTGISILHLYFGYRIFKRYQIITSKWFNI